jgi:hypothetical protein
VSRDRHTELKSAVRVYLDWLGEHRKHPRSKVAKRELAKLESELRARTGWTKSRGRGS